MKIPYTEIELRVALVTAAEKLETQQDDIVTAVNSLLPDVHDQASMNEAAAQHHGISKLDLINSPNYIVLLDSFKEANIEKIAVLLEDKFGFTNREAWAITLAGTEVLK